MMHFTGSPMMIEVAASAGLDFVNIDMEHSPIGIELGGELDPHRRRRGHHPVRARAVGRKRLIMQLLNLGARGIIIPHADREECLAAVDAARYEPAGPRLVSRPSAPRATRSRTGRPSRTRRIAS